LRRPDQAGIENASGWFVAARRLRPRGLLRVSDAAVIDIRRSQWRVVLFFPKLSILTGARWSHFFERLDLVKGANLNFQVRKSSAVAGPSRPIGAKTRTR